MRDWGFESLGFHEENQEPFFQMIELNYFYTELKDTTSGIFL